MKLKHVKTIALSASLLAMSTSSAFSDVLVNASHNIVSTQAVDLGTQITVNLTLTNSSVDSLTELNLRGDGWYFFHPDMENTLDLTTLSSGETVTVQWQFTTLDSAIRLESLRRFALLGDAVTLSGESVAVQVISTEGAQ